MLDLKLDGPKKPWPIHKFQCVIEDASDTNAYHSAPKKHEQQVFCIQFGRYQGGQKEHGYRKD